MKVMAHGKMKYRQTVGLCSMEGRGFYYPSDTLITGDGKMYTVNRSLDGDYRGVRVTIYDVSEEYYGTFSEYGEKPGEMVWPTAISQTSDGNILIADEYLNRVSVFEPDGKLVSTWGNTGSELHEIDGPSGLAIDQDDRVFISDHRNHRIQVMSRTGNHLYSFGRRGDGDGQLNSPWGITIAPNGDVYVADWLNDRIQRFHPDGKFVASYGESGRGENQLFRPASVCVDSEGYIYIADWGNQRLKIMDPSGKVLQSLRGEATASRWAKIFLDINVEEARARENSDLETEFEYFVNDPHETSSHIEKLFWAPISVKMDSEETLYVTESNRHRIQIYSKA